MQEIINYNDCVSQTEKKHYILIHKYIKKAQKLITKGIKLAMKQGEFGVTVDVYHCFPGEEWVKEARPHLQAWIEAQGYYIRRYYLLATLLEYSPSSYNILWGKAAIEALKNDEETIKFNKDFKNENN